MADLINKLVAKAQAAPKRVALPEVEDPATLQVARRVLDEGIGTPVLVGDPEVIATTAAEAGVSTEGMEVVDAFNEDARIALVARYMAAGERMLSEKAYNRKARKNSLYTALMLESLGDVDCTFAGHVATTGDLLMATHNVIGLAEGVDVSSIMAIVEIPGFEGPEGDTLVFADCGLNPEPTAEELASIAIASADNAAAILGWDPRVAFLSFSTDGSGEGKLVDNVRSALEVARTRRPDLKFDGEFQLDAAIIPAVAEKKIQRESDVAGRANVLIFPELGAANLGIKEVQIFAHGKGFGHTLSGFKKPVSDSSRSSSVDEMFGDIAMLVLACGTVKE